jgi:predicted PurR-regulated permease PerM
MARIPPALLLFTVVAAGVVFGLGGVVVAAPLTVVGLVLVKKLYVRQVLGQETEVQILEIYFLLHNGQELDLTKP